MTSVEVMGHADEAEAPDNRRRRRAVWIAAAVIVVLVVGVAVWQTAARTARIVAGGTAASIGNTLPGCVPDGGTWSYFDADDAVVAAMTVRNPSRWPVTVSSDGSDAYRFERVSDDPQDDTALTFDVSDDGQVAAETSDEVTIPAGRSVVMWIIDPQRPVVQDSGVWYEIDRAPLRIESLGVAREFSLPFPGVLYVGGPKSSDSLDRALQEVCGA